MFHVNKLKRTLHPLENFVSPNILVELIKPPFAPHELEKIIGFKDRHMRQRVYEKALVKWNKLEPKASTWEHIAMLQGQKYP